MRREPSLRNKQPSTKRLRMTGNLPLAGQSLSWILLIPTRCRRKQLSARYDLPTFRTLRVKTMEPSTNQILREPCRSPQLCQIRLWTPPLFRPRMPLWDLRQLTPAKLALIFCQTRLTWRPIWSLYQLLTRRMEVHQ